MALLSQTVFHPIKIAVKEQVKQFEKLVNSTEVLPINLEQIITTQADEPAQKSCIYRVTHRVAAGSLHENEREKEKFT